MEYSWKFDAFKVRPELAGLSDVLVSYEWRRVATDLEHTAEVYGSVVLGEPESGKFTAYSDIVPSDLEAWTVAYLTPEVIESYDASLAATIEEMKNPSVVSKVAPWDFENL